MQNASARLSFQRLLQVRDQVIRVFQPYIYPDQAVIRVTGIKIGRIYGSASRNDQAFMPSPTDGHPEMPEFLAEGFHGIYGIGFQVKR
jgi:hypothetical protein